MDDKNLVKIALMQSFVIDLLKGYPNRETLINLYDVLTSVMDKLSDRRVYEIQEHRNKIWSMVDDALTDKIGKYNDKFGCKVVEAGLSTMIGNIYYLDKPLFDGLIKKQGKFERMITSILNKYDDPNARNSYAATDEFRKLLNKYFYDLEKGELAA